MQNHYKTLGVPNSATAQEIRRAYRILARRYHPDLSDDPGAADKFKVITEAYDTLSDQARRAQYDLELQNQERRAYDRKGSSFTTYNRGGTATERFHRAQRRPDPTKTQQQPPPQPPPAAGGPASPLTALMGSVKDLWRTLQEKKREAADTTSRSKVMKVSIIEASISVKDAILGIKKTVEVEEPSGMRKISVSIPAGVRSGSVVRLRARGDTGEELVLIIRVASHPFISIQPRGVVVEIPVTFQEALYGASISVPTLDTPVSIRIPPGSHSGFEIRVRERGVPSREGPPGDLFYRIMIQTPESPEAVGLKEKVQELEQYYGTKVRVGLPATILES